MATVLTPAEIKQKIEDWITTNGNHEITGAHLNAILAAIMDYVGVGYAFMGEAPASAPSPEVPVAYWAGPGTYTGYETNAVAVPDGSLCIFKYGGSWSKNVFKIIEPFNVSQETLYIGDTPICSVAGYDFMGVAPYSAPATPTSKVAFIGTSGVYSGYVGTIRVKQGTLVLFTFDDGWSYELIDLSSEDIYNQMKDVLYISDGNGNVVAKIEKEGVTAVGYGTDTSKVIDDGGNRLAITDAQGNVIFRVGKDYGVAEIIGQHYTELYNIGQVCWIDDDFEVLDGNNELKPIYEAVHDWCVENEIYLDFAYIPDSYGNTPVETARMQLLKSWENENFRFLMHPIHQGWFNEPSAGITYDVELVREGIVKCQRFFKINNILTAGKILVWPGSSNSFPANVEICKKYVDCAILASSNGTNPNTKNNRYQIQRYTIGFSASKTKTKVKKEIKEFLDRGDWVVLETHLYGFTVSDTLDEISNTTANLFDVVSYVNELYPLMPTEKIWEQRKYMYNYFNNN